ncbi:hypothetical protein [Pseudonocardia alni]|uniref:hypothetical protein n=1 Tax=Pseudonocardia alni TaxID=33907 RepID=UPI00280AE3C1|nr:hypothetical protein [Pseudonocardia alni]
MRPAPDGPAGTPDGPAGGAPGADRPPVRTAPAARTALAGLAAAALGVGAGQALALLVAPAAGPVNAVAEQVVALTPPALAGAATVGAGIGSRHTVVAGVLVVLVLAAAGLGALSRRSPWPGAWGLAALGLLGVVAAATASGAGQLDMVPAGAAAVVAVTVFRRLHALAARIPAPTADGTLPDGRPVRSSLTRRRFLRTTALAGRAGPCWAPAPRSPRPCCPRAGSGPHATRSPPGSGRSPRRAASRPPRRCPPGRRCRARPRSPPPSTTSTGSTPRCGSRRLTRRRGACGCTGGSGASSPSPSTTCWPARSSNAG